MKTVKRGFRSLVIGEKQYLYRVGKKRTEIRKPDGSKLIVAHWEVFGLTEEEWYKRRWVTLCGPPDCNCGVRGSWTYAVRPGTLRKYLESLGS